jgi:hypothetical protein
VFRSRRGHQCSVRGYKVLTHRELAINWHIFHKSLRILNHIGSAYKQRYSLEDFLSFTTVLFMYPLPPRKTCCDRHFCLFIFCTHILWEKAGFYTGGEVWSSLDECLNKRCIKTREDISENNPVTERSRGKGAGPTFETQPGGD